MSIAATTSRRALLPRQLAKLLWPLGIVAVLAAAVYFGLPLLQGGNGNGPQNLITHKVQRGEFIHNVIEPGELESANNVEVRCEVEARNSSGTVLLEIVPNGTEVLAGDFLMRFDSSALEQERTQQQIVVNDTKALVINSRNTFETAEIAKREYLEGTFLAEEQVVLGELFVAEENLRRAEEYARYSERLAAKGYVTSDQVDADKFAVEKSRNDVEAVKTKLKVLREFTKAKNVKTLDAAIQTADAKLKSDEYTLQLAVDKLAHIEQQIKNCKVFAPTAGKVVYANRSDRRGNSEVIIEEGSIIRERQAVLRLPDLSSMQVIAKINEARISFVESGMEATVRVDAFPGMELKGKVTRVDEYPLPPSYFSQNVKQYATHVQVNNAPAGVRPGLTAQVEIQVEKIPGAVTVPVQAVFERNGEYYCGIRTAAGIEPQWLDIGPTNDQEVLIRNGLAGGEEVVLNPEPLLADATLPAAPLGYWEKNPRYETLTRRMNKASGDTAAKGPGGVREGGPRNEGEPATAPRNPAAMLASLFDQFDTDKDGAILLTDLPDNRRERMSRADADGDGRITRAEMTASFARRPPGAGPREGEPSPTGGAQ